MSQSCSGCLLFYNMTTYLQYYEFLFPLISHCNYLQDYIGVNNIILYMHIKEFRRACQNSINCFNSTTYSVQCTQPWILVRFLQHSLWVPLFACVRLIPLSHITISYVYEGEPKDNLLTRPEISAHTAAHNLESGLHFG